MKKIILALACLGTAHVAIAQTTPSAAGNGATIKWGGSLKAEYEDRNNYDGNDAVNDHHNEIYQTTILTADVVKNDDLAAHLTLRNLNLWGDQTAFASKDTIAAKGTNSRSNGIIVQEAYGWWKANDHVSLQFGRGGYALGSGELISRNDEQNVPTSFEGVLALADYDWGRIGLFGVKAVDGGFGDTTPSSVAGGSQYATNTSDGEGRFYGVTYEVKTLPEFLTSMNIHYIMAMSNSINLLPSTVGTEDISRNDRQWLGISTKGETAGFDYRLAYENMTGKVYAAVGGADVDRKAHMGEVEAGFTFTEMKNFRIGATYHTESGDNGIATDKEWTTYDPLYYNRKNNGGRMAIVGWGQGVTNPTATRSGLNDIAAKLSADPTEKLNVVLMYHMFKYAKSSTDDDIGNEADLILTHKYDNGIKAWVEYGMFMPGKAWVADDDNAQRIALGTSFDF